MSFTSAQLAAFLAARPVTLAPMDGVSDAVFRRLCRSVGAELCFTEFVNVGSLLRGCRTSRRKMTLAPDDRPTAIQIYGGDPDQLLEAARIAEAAEPAFLDINCGCWVPRIVARGGGAGWLRDPAAMVAMAKQVVEGTALPVTVKTRIGYGPESHMPIVDLARRLEDAGVRAITIHCRTALARHEGPADWEWARRAREAVSIPVIVNGDVRSAADVASALDATGCAAAMVGRGAIDHPWVFREARALLDRGETTPPPSVEERLALARTHLAWNVESRGERPGIFATRRHVRGYLRGVPGADALWQALIRADRVGECLSILDGAGESAARAA
jgi:tRNA-dihydrouridine synthase B